MVQYYHSHSGPLRTRDRALAPACPARRSPTLHDPDRSAFKARERAV